MVGLDSLGCPKFFYTNSYLVKMTNNKKRILIDLDMRVYKKLSKIARSKSFKLKPFCELVLRNFVKEEMVSVKDEDKL